MSETLQSTTALTRFDDTYTAFDQRDLIAIERSAHIMFAQDQMEYGGLSVFFARQLDYVKTRTYERLYPEVNASMLVPDATDTPEWAESITLTTFDAVGMAKVISNYADDLPRADVRGMQVTVPVKTIGDSYGYNVNELRASRATGAGLDTRKAEAARRAIELKLNLIKMVGDEDYGLYGLLNHPNIGEIILPHPGPWAPLSATQVYENLMAMTNQFKAQTYGVHTANFLGLAPDAYNAAATKVFLVGQAPVTALQFFQQMNPGVQIANIYEFKGADDGHDMAMLYERSAENLTHEMVMAFNQLPPEARNLEFVINCIARTGGVHVWYPLAFLRALTS